MNDKLTDQNRSTLIFVTIILFYIIYSIVDARLNYYEIRYKTTAIVVDMYTEYNDNNGFSRETNYLHIKYGDNDYGGLIHVSRSIYNTVNIGDTILIRIYERYRRSDDVNVECRLTFERVLEDV